jgi:hypothetical protein
MRRFLCIFSSILLLVVFPSLVRAAGATTLPAIYATPADVVAAADKALHAGNAQVLVDCLDADSQEKLTQFFLFAMASDLTDAPATAPSDKQKAAFNAKYALDHVQRLPGETDEQMGDRLAKQIKDKRQFLIDMTLQLNDDNKKSGKVIPPMELDNLHIQPDGTTAVGQLVHRQSDGTSDSQDVQFKKIDGAWKFDGAVMF